MTLPTIGITLDSTDYVDSRGTSRQRYEIPGELVRAVEQSGGLPVLLPFFEHENALQALQHLDGLILSGGDFDIPPELYDAQPHPKLGKLNRPRTKSEIHLLTEGLKSNLPILGICGGMQLLQVHFGGPLVQDLSARPGLLQHEQPHNKSEPHHPVATVQYTKLREICGLDFLNVNSTHHQVVHTIAPGLAISATSHDGVIEGLESPRHTFVLGVQWHPEYLLHLPEHQAIFDAFITAAAQRR